MKRIQKSQRDYCGGYHQTLRDNYWKECRIVGDQRSSEDAVRNQSCFRQAWTSQAKSTRLYWIRSTRKQGGGTWDIIVLGVSDMVSNFRSIPIEIREFNFLIWLSFVTVLSRYLLKRTVITVLQRETKTNLTNGTRSAKSKSWIQSGVQSLMGHGQLVIILTSVYVLESKTLDDLAASM